MKIRIHAEDENGVLQLDYDDSKEQPFNGYGYKTPPCTNDVLETAVDLIVADHMRQQINQEVKSES
jgi:hypothetical protein